MTFIEHVMSSSLEIIPIYIYTICKDKYWLLICTSKKIIWFNLRSKNIEKKIKILKKLYNKLLFEQNFREKIKDCMK